MSKAKLKSMKELESMSFSTLRRYARNLQIVGRSKSGILQEIKSKKQYRPTVPLNSNLNLASKLSRPTQKRRSLVPILRRFWNWLC